MNIAYIGLGSNIEPRKQYLDQAIQKLTENSKIKLQKQSSIYETEPVSYTNQDKFLNMVIEINTSFTSLELLIVCQEIETLLGRERMIKNGPRTLDLDILLFNSENKDLDRLQIPHPRLHERAFVLVPLCEIAPHLKMPTSGKVIKAFLNNLPHEDLTGVVKWREEYT